MSPTAAALRPFRPATMSPADKPDTTPTRRNRIGAAALYFLGVAWIAAMGFVAAWPDMEASVFDAGTSVAADARLSVRCPWVMAADEEAEIGVAFANHSERTERFLVRTRVSRGFVTLVHEDSQQVVVEPGVPTRLTWTANAEDAAYGRLVLARVFATRSAVSPARDGSCGVFVVGISGVNGDLLFLGSVLLGLVVAASGATLWWRARRPLGARQIATARRVGMLAALAAASLLAGMLGWWLLSHLLLVAGVLFVFMLLERAYSDQT